MITSCNYLLRRLTDADFLLVDFLSARFLYTRTCSLWYWHRIVEYFSGFSVPYNTNKRDSVLARGFVPSVKHVVTSFTREKSCTSDTYRRYCHKLLLFIVRFCHHQIQCGGKNPLDLKPTWSGRHYSVLNTVMKLSKKYRLSLLKFIICIIKYMNRHYVSACRRSDCNKYDFNTTSPASRLSRMFFFIQGGGWLCHNLYTGDTLK